jgi:hypothetical protein
MDGEKQPRIGPQTTHDFLIGSAAPSKPIDAALRHWHIFCKEAM